MAMPVGGQTGDTFVCTDARERPTSAATKYAPASSKSVMRYQPPLRLEPGQSGFGNVITGSFELLEVSGCRAIFIANVARLNRDADQILEGKTLLGEANSIIEHCQSGFNWLGSICLAAFGTVEEHPHREIPGEVLKAVFDPCGCEQNVMRTERLALSAANKLTCALRYDIDLIA